MKRKVVLAFLLTGALVLSGCSKTNNSNETSSGSTSTDSSAQGIDVSNMFSDRDKEIGYDEENSTVIKLSDDSTTCDSDAVQISGNTVTIIDEGTYILSGTLTDGMVIVDAEDTDKVQLVLDGVDITSAESAAIYVREADKVFIMTASDSQNTLTNGGTYTAIDDNNIDAAIFSKSDLTLNGAGSLTITAKAGHGVVSKDDLVLTSRTYQIDAASHGLSGKDSVRIASGSYTIVSGKDGIHAENADDTSLGFVYLADGTFDITSDGDGISAGNWLQADGGVYTVKAGGGSENVQKSDGEWQFGPGQQTESTDTTEEDTVSMKAIKAAGELILKGGSILWTARMTRFIPMQISQSVMGNLHLLPVMTEFMQIQRQPFPEELLILQKVMRELKGSALILQAVKLMCQVRQMMEQCVGLQRNRNSHGRNLYCCRFIRNGGEFRRFFYTGSYDGHSEFSGCRKCGFSF